MERAEVFFLDRARDAKFGRKAPPPAANPLERIAVEVVVPAAVQRPRLLRDFQVVGATIGAPSHLANRDMHRRTPLTAGFSQWSTISAASRNASTLRLFLSVSRRSVATPRSMVFNSGRTSVEATRSPSSWTNGSDSGPRPDRTRPPAISSGASAITELSPRARASPAHGDRRD